MTPWQVAARKAATVRVTPVYRRDPYNFSSVTTSNGTNPRVTIPATGPHAAGAPPPVSARTVIDYTVTTTGTETWPGYGNNLGTPVA